MKDLPDSNPKTVHGLAKPGIADVPPCAILLLGLGHRSGSDKYGRMNWREHEVTASVYYDALFRHAGKWWDGEEVDEESGLPHFAHMLACISILADAQSLGKLNDDRPPETGRFSDLVRKFTKPLPGKPCEVDLPAWPDNPVEGGHGPRTEAFRAISTGRAGSEFVDDEQPERPEPPQEGYFGFKMPKVPGGVSYAALQEKLAEYRSTHRQARPEAERRIEGAKFHLDTNIFPGMDPVRQLKLFYYLQCWLNGLDLTLREIDGYLSRIIGGEQ